MEHLSPRATAFIVSIIEFELGWHYLVTAEHVVSSLRGHDIWVRSNTKDGKAIENQLSNALWWFHPDNAHNATDVALTLVDFSANEDHVAIPLNQDTAIAATDLVLRSNGIGVGHEVHISGLFRSHYGQERNVPIVRVGNIAMMLGEKVYTKYCGCIDAYLIEARSISGLSGSPVFINIPMPAGGSTLQLTRERTHLLGLMHGHFDVQNLSDDIVVDADVDPGRGIGINTGIGVVIPVEKILETLQHPGLVSRREQDAAKFRSGMVDTD
jgi:hypothetical protein